MPESEPNSQQILALLLGASSFRRAPKLAQGRAFYNSAQDFYEYLTGSEGLSLARENVNSLFDDSRSPSDQLQDIRDFLESRSTALKNEGLEPQDLILYYVGHGLFSGVDHTYCLAIRVTDERNEGLTSIRASDLASIIRGSARFVRKFLILDCCFSAAAYKEFQSGPLTAGRTKLLDELPQRGTTLLCSASAQDPSLAPEGLSRTMFSDGLLRALHQGHPFLGPRLSLSELGDLVKANIRESYPNDWVRPEVHSPDQREGDVASVPLFPNAAYFARKAAEEKRQKVEAQRIREEAEARRKAEAQRMLEEAEALERAEAERKLREVAEARQKAEALRMRQQAEARERAEEECKAQQAEEAWRKAEALRMREEAEAGERTDAERQAQEAAEALRKAKAETATESGHINTDDRRALAETQIAEPSEGLAVSSFRFDSLSQPPSLLEKVRATSGRAWRAVTSLVDILQSAAEQARDDETFALPQTEQPKVQPEQDRRPLIVAGVIVIVIVIGLWCWISTSSRESDTNSPAGRNEERIPSDGQPTSPKSSVTTQQTNGEAQKTKTDINSTEQNKTQPGQIAPPKLSPLHVSQGVLEGLLTTKVQPEYPQMARIAHIEGDVMLQAIVSKSGDIEYVRALNGHPILIQAALNAVRQWKCKPYKVNGEPVAVQSTVIVHFELPRKDN
jgi:TonB family protein